MVLWEEITNALIVPGIRSILWTMELRSLVMLMDTILMIIAPLVSL